MIPLKKYAITLIIIAYIFFDAVLYADFGLVTEKSITFILNGTILGKSFNLNIIKAVYNPRNKEIYVISPSKEKGRLLGKIAKKNGSKYKFSFIATRQDMSIKGVAFNHGTSMLYWIADGDIFRAKLENNEISNTLTSTSVVSFEGSNGNPDGLTIDVHENYLYWRRVDSITGLHMIERLRLNSNSPEMVVNDLINPVDITVDVKTNTLYWIETNDGKFHSLQSIGLWKNAKVNTLFDATQKRKPLVIALDDQYVYWIDDKSKGLWQMPKSSSKGDLLAEKLYSLTWEWSPIKLFVLSKSRTVKKKMWNH